MRTFLAGLALVATSLNAVELPALFSDHAVLQASGETPVWGRGRDGEQISVTIGTITARTTVAGGTWIVRLQGLQPTSHGQDLVVQGDTTLTVRDVLIGEVWLCSGQSNMFWPVDRTHNAAETKAKASDAGIRLFQVPRRSSPTPLRDVQARWQICSPATVGSFSAVGYHFARSLRQTRPQPMGLIDCSWGGTGAQSWVSVEGLSAPPAFSHYLAARETYLKDYDRLKAEWPAAQQANAVLQQQAKEAQAAALAAWKEACAKAQATGEALPPKPATPPAPTLTPDPDAMSLVPANLFNGMVSPLLPVALTGVLWYQGESNVSAAEEYASLFPRLITDWRNHWGRPELPFLFVHLSTWQNAQKDPVERGPIPQLRQSQLAALALPKTAMTTAIDINNGSDVHPANKQIVGERLAQVARKVVYGEDVPCESPTFRAATVEGSVIRIALDHAAGLHVAEPAWLGPKATRPSATEPSAFALCGANGVWHWAKVRIDGETIVLSSAEVPAPVAAAHAWASNPAINVFNTHGLPLLPFVSDPALLRPVKR